MAFPTERASWNARYLGREHILFWQNGAGVITEVCQKGATFRGQSAWNGVGVVIGQMSSLPATLYTGEKFSNTVAVVVPYDPAHLLPIWAFCSSPEFAQVQKGATFRGQSDWNGVGVVIGQMSSLPATLYTGEKFSNTVAGR